MNPATSFNGDKIGFKRVNLFLINIDQINKGSHYRQDEMPLESTNLFSVIFDNILVKQPFYSNAIKDA